MTKKELEIQNDILIGKITDCGKRIQENIDLIDNSLKIEKNIEKKKLLSGLRNEFLYLQKIILIESED